MISNLFFWFWILPAPDENVVYLCFIFFSNSNTVRTLWSTPRLGPNIKVFAFLLLPIPLICYPFLICKNDTLFFYIVFSIFPACGEMIALPLKKNLN